MFRSTILCCGGTGCHSNNSGKIIEEFKKQLKENNLESDVQVVETGCFGLCAVGPVVIIYPEGAFYSAIKPEDVQEIVQEHIIKGRLVERLLYKEKKTHDAVKALSDTNFYKKQTRVALRNCGVINPENIDEYIAYDGYQALIKCLTEMKPQEIIDVIKASGLRGRGGGGFPTGNKWQFAMNTVSDVKYVCCNADEGDPGAFMDRSMMESVPFQVLEGMLIGAYATGATKLFIYCRAEYPLAIKHLKIAIKAIQEAGLDKLPGREKALEIRIKEGAGAFVCGEETSMIASLEGKRGTPRFRPPFPTDSGWNGLPTAINNVETFANIAPLLAMGAEKFASIGSEKSKGTKIFALAGDLKNPGLTEVPMGVTLAEIVYDIEP